MIFEIKLKTKSPCMFGIPGDSQIKTTGMLVGNWKEVPRFNKKYRESFHCEPLQAEHSKIETTKTTLKITFLTIKKDMFISEYAPSPIFLWYSPSK